jgi:hypothetical protein
MHVAGIVDRQHVAHGDGAPAGCNVAISTDTDKLRQSFPFGDPQYGVALENGRLVVAIGIFEGNEPNATLKCTGLIE